MSRIMNTGNECNQDELDIASAFFVTVTHTYPSSLSLIFVRITGLVISWQDVWNRFRSRLHLESDRNFQANGLHIYTNSDSSTISSPPFAKSRMVRNLYSKHYSRVSDSLVVMNFTEMEAKVREATNNEPWGASSTQLNEIADGTHNL